MLPLLVLCASQLSAFEQGNYYIFDLIENSKTGPVTGRIAISKKALSPVEAPTQKTATTQRGEFEIDYSQSMHASEANSAFNLEMPTSTKPAKQKISFSSESFDFGTSETVFGE
jgi:hypothetical protein